VSIRPLTLSVRANKHSTGVFLFLEKTWRDMDAPDQVTWNLLH
jgi:hypothetical protein